MRKTANLNYGTVAAGIRLKQPESFGWQNRLAIGCCFGEITTFTAGFKRGNLLRKSLKIG